ncbi:MAG: S53 family peptidase [Acidimicrobiales bacterium]
MTHPYNCRQLALLALAATTALVLAGIPSASATAAPSAASASSPGRNVGAPAVASGRVALPDPVPSWTAYSTDDGPAGSKVHVPVRLYLSGHATAEAVFATAASTPGSAAYGHYLTPAEFEARFGPTAAQVSAVQGWAKSEGLSVTSTTLHYVAVTGAAPVLSRALATSIHAFSNSGGLTGYAPVDGASLPASIASDVTTVLGLDSYNYPTNAVPAGTPATPAPLPTPVPAPGAPAATSAPAPTAAPATTAVSALTSSYHCSSWWGENSGSIPKAYGETNAPDAVCGYSPQQLRSAYGVAASAGKGATIAIVLDGHLASMDADANRFFAAHHVAGFAAGQFTQNFGPGFVASCGSTYADLPEEPLDVATAHIIAPAAKVVYVAVNCSNDTPVFERNFLDAETRIVDDHLADVETDSYSTLESEYTQAMAAAWTQILEQGAVEGIGFNFDAGDGDVAPAVEFPASDPWATAVGGTALEIGKSGAVTGELGWGDDIAQENRAGTAYLQAPPGDYVEGSTGGRSNLFAQPAYQHGVVPSSLSTLGGTVAAGREVPDVAADASPFTGWLIGYTPPGAPYQQVVEGGTSGASPIVAALEADAMHVAGHAIGFANPALYGLRRSAAIRDVTPSASPATAVAPTADCFNFVGGVPVQRCLVTLGLDGTQKVTAGYDDVTGIGAPTTDFVALLARA